ncbi:MAG: hypothetical protein IJL87_04530 [Clostridia bacterium]|nr:hypothetical protein [Clostridia bacterium]
MNKKEEFLKISGNLNNELNIIPLLFGSLGLEQRLGIDLNPDDIDILIPEIYLNDNWEELEELLGKSGYRLYDLHEHAFSKNSLNVAFAALESLKPFADIDISRIPVVEEKGIKYYLLDLKDYLKVYTASAKDGYRVNKKNKQDSEKIRLIEQAL